MDQLSFTSWILVSELGKTPSKSKRPHERPGERTIFTPVSAFTNMSRYSTYLPGAIPLVHAMVEELTRSPQSLLALNRSRREALVLHLDALSGQSRGPSSLNGGGDPSGGLRRWLGEPKSPAEQQALIVFYEEIALIWLGQAILLKHWHDLEKAQWNENALTKLNSKLFQILSERLPLGRVGWNLTQQNLYSWYNPTYTIQEKIFRQINEWTLINEDSHFLPGLLKLCTEAERKRAQSPYDPRFYSALWSRLECFGANPSPRVGWENIDRFVFCPTLRDGSVVRSFVEAQSTGQVDLHFKWLGLESRSFDLLLAEMAELWNGPKAPMLWAMGTGLEVHAREQLDLRLQGSVKPSIYSRLAEVEACEIAYVSEDNEVRTTFKDEEGLKFREALEAYTYFKTMRSPAVTLGTLQAAVAMTKLRPGGILFWARNEPVRSDLGSGALQFLLERGKLECSWDLSGVNHTLPSTGPLFPRYLYMFRREPRVEQLRSSRPIIITVQGQIKSHVEVPQFLDDLFRAWHETPTHRDHWNTLRIESPLAQSDWIEKWPDPTDPERVKLLESLKSDSVPLGSLATIRSAPTKGYAALSKLQDPRAFFLVEAPDESSRLETHAMGGLEANHPRSDGVLVVAADPAWVPALRAYLESSYSPLWLNFFSEKKRGRFILHEQTVKCLPVPGAIARALERGADLRSSRSEGVDWENLVASALFEPKLLSEAIEKLPLSENSDLLASLFCRAACALSQHRDLNSALFTLVGGDGKIRWRELIRILPEKERRSLLTHPEIRVTANLPPHLPITRAQRTQSQMPGYLLVTEGGLHTHVGTASTELLAILTELLSPWLANTREPWPTWSELTRTLWLPLDFNTAKQTASDVLQTTTEQLAKQKELTRTLTLCLKFIK